MLYFVVERKHGISWETDLPVGHVLFTTEVHWVEEKNEAGEDLAKDTPEEEIKLAKTLMVLLPEKYLVPIEKMIDDAKIQLDFYDISGEVAKLP